jgi:hypothetical protein
VWKLCRLPAPGYSANAAAFLIDRHRCSSVLALWRWIVDRAYFFTGYLDGEGGAAQLAFTKLSMPVPLSDRLATCFWSDSQSETPPIIQREVRTARQLFSSACPAQS